jgi:hypothetical protein
VSAVRHQAAAMSTHKSWRDVLPVHPAAEMLPAISPEALRALGENIKAVGLGMPIVVWYPRPPSFRITNRTTWRAFVEKTGALLLDGRHRLDAMELDGIRAENDGSWCYCDESGALGGYPSMTRQTLPLSGGKILMIWPPR